MNKEALRELRERVEKAAGPDREIDTDLATLLKEVPPGAFRIIGTGSGATFGFGAYNYWNAPTYTASIDAALALVERMLPGWTVARLSQQNDRSWFCELREGYLTSYNRVAMSNYRSDLHPANLPIAILSALLSALEAQAE